MAQGGAQRERKGEHWGRIESRGDGDHELRGMGARGG